MSDCCGRYVIYDHKPIKRTNERQKGDRRLETVPNQERLNHETLNANEFDYHVVECPSIVFYRGDVTQIESDLPSRRLRLRVSLS